MPKKKVKDDHSSRTHPSLNRSPRKNEVERRGGLPSYIERIARHIEQDSGLDRSHAIAAAVNRVKELAAKGNKEAQAALADWNRRIKGKRKGASLSYEFAPAVFNGPSHTSKGQGIRSTRAGKYTRSVTRGNLGGGYRKPFDEGKVRRGYGGRFSNKYNSAQGDRARRIVEGAITSLKVGQVIELPGGLGKVMRREDGTYLVSTPNGIIPAATASEAVAIAADTIAPKVAAGNAARQQEAEKKVKAKSAKKRK